MLIATTVMLLGLLAVILAAQLGGYRLGGVVVIPLVAVYLLWNFGTFPVFVLSTVAAYVSLHYIKSRLPLYGRPLFVLSLLIGALVPIAVFELVGVTVSLSPEVEFLGSILPGIAAYNFHRLSVEKRMLDAVWSLAVVLFLTVVGIGLTIAVGLTPLADSLPPVLLSPQSDIANAFGLVVERSRVPIVASSWVSFGVITLGMSLCEAIRSRYGLRIAGVIVVPLVVLMSFRNAWMVGLWAVTAVLSYGGIQLVHRWTLLYGRVQLGFGIILALLTAISLTPSIPITPGLLPFFAGVFGGVTAYNLHVVAPAERRATLAVTAAVFVVVTFAARFVVSPSPSGMLRRVTDGHFAVGGALVALAAWELLRLERIRPSDFGTSGVDGLRVTERGVSDSER